jgi:hypothetical protein
MYCSVLQLQCSKGGLGCPLVLAMVVLRGKCFDHWHVFNGKIMNLDP